MMPMKPLKLERILCPTNLSPDSDEAIRYAIALAKAYGAELVLMYCQTMGDELVRQQDYESANDAIAAALRKHAGRAGIAGLQLRSLVIKCDDVGATIVNEAASLGVDLIVMRSRCRPHPAALLGSTAESVSRTAPCPVLVMHADERDWVTESAADIELKRVLVAYDFSDYSELALNYALSFAQEYQSELHLLHVCHLTLWMTLKFPGTR